MAATTRMRSPQEEHSSGSQSQVRAMRRAQLRLRFRTNSPSSSRVGRRVGVSDAMNTCLPPPWEATFRISEAPWPTGGAEIASTSAGILRSACTRQANPRDQEAKGNLSTRGHDSINLAVEPQRRRGAQGRRDGSDVLRVHPGVLAIFSGWFPLVERAVDVHHPKPPRPG